MPFEGIEVHNHIKSDPSKGLSAAVVERAHTTTRLEYMRRHWNTDALGSVFTPNQHFQSLEEMLELLEQVAGEVIGADELNRQHIVTLEFDSPIGVNGITEIQPGDQVLQEMRDGKNMVNVVSRKEPLPPTNLLTLQANPVFPKKDSGGTVTFQITNAFPGPPAPPLADTKYWNSHAFLRVASPPAA